MGNDLPTVADIEMSVDDIDLGRAKELFDEHGCLVVRGLMRQYVDALKRDINEAADRALSMLDRAEKIVEGWRTPDGTLFIPAPEGYDRDKQIMVLSIGYNTSGAFLQSALDETALDIVSAILGPNVEMFGGGQCLVKEPVGGHPKHLHQDAAYFEHRYYGPVAILNYAVDTDLENGALHVVPGSHKLGQLQHVDTFSHLGLDDGEWPWERALPVCGEAGDGIFFHYRTIHGSKQNHSNARRPVFINRYRSVEDYTIIGATTTANRAEAEKRAAEVTKGGERGLVVRGYRSYTEQ